MTGTKLVPEKITHPFQLMAAWFAMLVLLVSVLLTASANIEHPDWAAGYLVIFASLVVLVVFACVTLMLTKFRPHLQDGKEYAAWLKSQNMYVGTSIAKSREGKSTSVPESRILRKSTTANPNFPVYLSNLPGAQRLVAHLEARGFSASIYEHSEINGDPAQHEAIWLGSNVDPAVAVQAMKLAVEQWPHLKYVHLSTDGGSPPDESHYEIYLGGATSTARQYELKEWTAADIEKLSEKMTRAAFHSAVRAKYS